MLLDVATFLIAMATLLFVRIPHPARDESSPTHFWADLSFGLRFIRERPGLIALLLIFMGMNFFGTLTYMSLIPVMVLARTGGDELAWATVQMALGLGGVVGGIIASVWRGPRRRIHAIYGGAALSFLFGDALLGLGRTVPVWAVAAFIAAVFIPPIIANDRAIWQSKTPPAAQGRVFAANVMIRISTMPLAALAAGPLADRIFEPAMAEGGWLTPIFGPLVGTGPGAGVAVLFLGTCVLGTAMSLGGYLWRPARCVETDLPDHVSVPVEMVSVQPRAAEG
jgi:predicted MFS family arabinose efflux permease